MFVALHVHSDRSYDGKMSLDDLRDFLLAEGIAAALMAEHAEDFDEVSYREYCKSLEAASSEEFLFVPGLEFRCVEGPHILGLGLDRFVPGEPKAREWLDSMRNAGAITVLAHPSYPPDPVSTGLANLFDAVEVWNVPCEGGWFPDPRKFRIYRSMRSQNPKILAVGGVDLHSVSGYKRVVLHMESPATWEALRPKLLTGEFEIEAGGRRYSSSPDMGTLESLFFRLCHGGYRWGRSLRDTALRLKRAGETSTGKAS